jgi:hypothetical protein
VANLLCHRNPFASGTNLCDFADDRVFFGRISTNPTVIALGGSIKLSTRGKATSTGYFSFDGRKMNVSSSVSTNGAIPIAFSSAQFDSFVGWANVGFPGDLTVSGSGVLIPATTNTPETFISISGPPP